MSDTPTIAYAHIYLDREGGGGLTTFTDPAPGLTSYTEEVSTAYDTSEAAFYLIDADGQNTHVASGGEFGPSTPAEAISLVREALNL